MIEGKIILNICYNLLSPPSVGLSSLAFCTPSSLIIPYAE